MIVTKRTDVNPGMDATEPLSPVKQALLELRTLRARLAEAEQVRNAPIAIVGMGLRAPGDVSDPDALWSLLREGRDAITETPIDRWDNDLLFDADADAPGKVTTRYGGFVRDVDRFDASFFGISRREADSMDPQQRLLLEVTWEALERAGIAPDTLAGSDAGFFLGIANSDYWRALYADPAGIDVYSGMGGALSVAAGRLLYFFGAHGPTLSLDTACSSSLVSLHLACQSLRLGETSLAVAGGVSLILTPEGTINFSKARMLATDGRCKTFDAAADGYVRSEGCVMLVLKRLTDARADGDRVLAIVRGSAVNQDGRSNGLTAPSGAAQEAVIRQALALADVAPSAVHYVEAHGTGTSLGDPIELRALGAVYGIARSPDNPLVVGSVKTNLGHLEAAAGAIGMAKVVLAMQHAQIPPHLHVSQPTTLVDWHSQHLRLPAHDGEAWPRLGDQRRIAAVSSFGFSGTNAHVVIEEGDEPVPAAARLVRPVHVVPLTAHTPAALRHMAAAYADVLDARGAAKPEGLAEMAYAAAVSRAHLRGARHTIIARDDAEASASLRRVADGVVDVATPGTDSRPRIAMLFTGQGAQSPGMGRDLYHTAPVFRDVLDRCSAIIERELGVPLDEILWGERADALLADTRFGQPAIIAIELAMAAMWSSWGVEPSVVAGHSLGEFAAAAFAGVLSAEDALRLVIARGQLVDRLPPDVGGMMVIAASRAVVEKIVAEVGVDALALAADNGPAQIVVSGPVTALQAAEAAFAARNIECRRLAGVRHAFHSGQMDEILPAFSAVAERVPMVAPRVAWVSGLTGKLMPADAAPQRDYFVSQTRGTVRFHDVGRELNRLGVTACIEVGPHPVLTAQLAEMAAQWTESASAIDIRMLPSMRRGADSWVVLSEAVAGLHEAGADIDWRAFHAPFTGARMELPTYPFERQRYWLPSGLHHAAGMAAAASSPDRSTRRWDAAQRFARAQSEQAPIGVDVGAYASHWALLKQYSTALIVDMFRAGQTFARAGESLSASEVADRVGIADSHHRLLTRWLHRLVQEGLLRTEHHQFISDTPLPALDLEPLRAAVDMHLAADPPLLAYVQTCARLLRDVMTGRASALETLFPDGSMALAEALYSTAGSARYINALAAAAIQALVEHPPAHRPPRVLEIGGGTGGTSGALVDRLAGSGAEYWFTDVSEAFLGRAHERFGAQVGLRTAVFDAERPGSAQDLPAHGFDVITASNALHAVRNLTDTIGHVRELLTPGGFLVLIETTTHHAWFDVSTGLIEGWQHFDDALRTDVPLLDADSWRAALRAGGFAEVVTFPGDDAPAAAMGQRVILARVAHDGRPEGTDRADVALDGIPAASRSEDARSTPDKRHRRAGLDVLAPSERIVRLRNLVRDAIATLLRRRDDEPIDGGARLMEEGVDSLMAVQLRGVLSRDLALEPALPATLIFEYPTIDAIAAHLLERLFPTVGSDVSPNEAERMNPLDSEQIAAMTDDEIAALLESRYGPTGAERDQ